MRINAHSHIFNAQSVFTTETLDIFIQRVKEIALPDFLEEKLVELLNNVFNKVDDYTVNEVVIENFIKEAAISERLRELSDEWKVKLNLENDEVLEKAGTKVILGVLEKFLGRWTSAESDAKKQHTLIDILNYIRVGLKPSIGAVTSHLMKNVQPDDVIVALMMDITKGGDKDKKIFKKQTADTSAQILRYPGRILPFFAVNPLRNGHFELMEQALTSKGFVGVKLYPSLGYDIQSHEVLKVLDYCHQRGTPILVHCSQGGFYADKDYINNSNPKLWDDILDDRPGLKICFGHFGGDKNFIHQQIEPDTWTQTIIDLMKKPKNTGVYADIAFHDSQMSDNEAEVNYFSILKTLLNDSELGRRVLFGTDFWMLCTSIKEKNYWTYFEKKIASPDIFQKLTSSNPKTFLGIADQAGKSEANIKNHIGFIQDNLGDAQLENAASWLSTELESLGVETLKIHRSSWASNNEAHRRVYRYLKANQMYPNDVEQSRFENSSFFSVSNLQYWNKGFESAAIFKGKCEAVAKGMDRYFRKNKADYENDVERSKAIGSLVNLFSDESTTFANLGKIVDQLYFFSWEADED